MALYDIKGRDALTSTSSASSGLSADWMQGDFNVNYGSGSLSAGGAAIPQWAWLAAAVLAGVWVWKHRR